jgi:O-methyltransferase involved in polyketide biosynthesis
MYAAGNPDSTKSKRFTAATPSTDNYGLGRTPGQRGAEILAGFRAEKSPSPETKALSKLSGRIVARVMMSMLRDSLPLNFTLSRPIVIDGLIRRSLPAQGEKLVFVDVAAGLSPRGMMLAQERPDIQVIEIDLPEVVDEKQQRLKRGRNIDMPSNLSWMAVNLDTTPLPEALGSLKAHVISSEGLLPYLHHPQIVRMGQWVLECLHPGGVFIADVPLRKGVQEIQQLASFFSRQAGNWYGTIDTQEQGRQLLTEAGFETVKTYHASDFILDFDLPAPLVDVSCFLQAVKHKADAPQTPSEPESGENPLP